MTGIRTTASGSPFRHGAETTPNRPPLLRGLDAHASRDSGPSEAQWLDVARGVLTVLARPRPGVPEPQRPHPPSPAQARQEAPTSSLALADDLRTLEDNNTEKAGFSVQGFWSKCARSSIFRTLTRKSTPEPWIHPHAEATLEHELFYQPLAKYRAKAQEARQELLPKKREEALKFFNKHIAPRLKTEEAALQQLAYDHAYLDLALGTSLHFNITRCLETVRQGTEGMNTGENLVTGNYARKYKVAASCKDKDVVAHLLLPREEEHNCDAIMTFCGTTPGVRDIKHDLNQRTRGFRPDFQDRNGIGHAAFAKSREDLVQWFDRCWDAGHSNRRVVMVGHSLGGALATRLAVCVPKEKAEQTLLVTYEAPGIDEASMGTDSAPKFHLPTSHVRHIWHHADPVRLPGVHPKGVGYELDNVTGPSVILETHTKPFLVDWELNGGQLLCARAGVAPREVGLVVEGLRKGGAKLWTLVEDQLVAMGQSVVG